MYNEGLIKTVNNPELNAFWSKGKSSAAHHMNILTHNNWFERLKLIYVSIFQWENLPDGIESDWIEAQLFERGQVAWFKTDSRKSPVNTNLCLPFETSGRVNIYGQPKKIIARGKTSDEFNVKFGEFIPIKSNVSAYAPKETAILYAYRLATVERTLDVNISNQKSPFVFKGTKDQQLSVMNFMQGFDDNETFFIVDEDFSPVDAKRFDIFNTNAPYVADKLMLYKHDILNEWLTFCGLSNANTDKKERLIVDEVNANNEEVKIGISTGLQMRKKAAEDINEMFGLNIKVNERDMSDVDFGFDFLMEGETDYEQVHNRAETSQEY